MPQSIKISKQKFPLLTRKGFLHWQCHDFIERVKGVKGCWCFGKLRFWLLWVTKASLRPNETILCIFLEKENSSEDFFLLFERYQYLVYFFIWDNNIYYFPPTSTLTRILKSLMPVQIIVCSYLLFWLRIVHELCSVFHLYHTLPFHTLRGKFGILHF